MALTWPGSAAVAAPAPSASTAKQPGTPARIAGASREFESVLLNQWLQGAESSFGSVPGGDEEDAEAEQTKGFATQQLAASMAAGGGIGIARLVQHGLAQHAAGATTTLAPSSLHSSLDLPGARVTGAGR